MQIPDLKTPFEKDLDNLRKIKILVYFIVLSLNIILVLISFLYPALFYNIGDKKVYFKNGGKKFIYYCNDVYTIINKIGENIALKYCEDSLLINFIDDTSFKVLKPNKFQETVRLLFNPRIPLTTRQRFNSENNDSFENDFLLIYVLLPFLVIKILKIIPIIVSTIFGIYFGFKNKNLFSERLYPK